MKKYIALFAAVILILAAAVIPAETYAENIHKTIPFPEYYLNECPKCGTVQTLSLSGVRDICVYTPYGYDEAEQYDVVLLLHGSGGDITDWITKSQNVFSRRDCVGISGRKLYDWMIYEGKIKPVIIASIDNNYRNTYKELETDVNNVIKAIVDNFSTFAPSFSDENITNARKHFTIGGLSMGSMFLMRYMLDYPDFFGNYLLISGYSNIAGFQKELAEIENKPEKVFIGCGVDDWFIMYARRINEFMPQCSYDVEFVEYAYGHNWRTWFSSIYDSLIYLYGTDNKHGDFQSGAKSIIKRICSTYGTTLISQ